MTRVDIMKMAVRAALTYYDMTITEFLVKTPIGRKNSKEVYVRAAYMYLCEKHRIPKYIASNYIKVNNGNMVRHLNKWKGESTPDDIYHLNKLMDKEILNHLNKKI